MELTKEERLWLETMGGRKESDVLEDEQGKYILLKSKDGLETIKRIPKDFVFRGRPSRSRKSIEARVLKVKLTEEEKKQKARLKRHLYWKEYYKKNEQRLKEKNKKYYIEHPEIRKEYYEKNKEDISAKRMNKRLASGWKPKTDFIYLHKICRFCKAENVPLVKQAIRNGRQYWSCRKCNTELSKKYRNTEKGRLNIRKACYKTIKKYPHKQRAREILNAAVHKGEITKPKICDHCKEEKNRICGHHPDYSAPKSVLWLCVGCHSDLHRELKEANRL